MCTQARMAEALPRQGCLVSVKVRLGGPECITEIILPDVPQKEDHRKKIPRGVFSLLTFFWTLKRKLALGV